MSVVLIASEEFELNEMFNGWRSINFDQYSFIAYHTRSEPFTQVLTTSNGLNEMSFSGTNVIISAHPIEL